MTRKSSQSIENRHALAAVVERYIYQRSALVDHKAVSNTKSCRANVMARLPSVLRKIADPVMLHNHTDTGSCIAYKDECRYDKPPSIAYVRSLEEEVQELKSQLRSFKTQVWLAKVLSSNFDSSHHPCMLMPSRTLRMKGRNFHPHHQQTTRRPHIILSD